MGIGIEYQHNQDKFISDCIDGGFCTGPLSNTQDADQLLDELNKRYGLDDSLLIYNRIVGNEELSKLASFQCIHIS